MRAKRRYDSPSDVAVCGEVWPLVGRREGRVNDSCFVRAGACRVPFARACIAEGHNAPAEDKQSSRIFGRDLTTVVFVWEGGRGGVEDEEVGKVQE